MIRGSLASLSAIFVIAAWMGAPDPGAAQEVRLCNPVLDYEGDPVTEAGGGVVTHAGTFECPPEEEEMAEMEPEEPETRGIEPAAGPLLPEQETVYFAFDVSELDDEGQNRIGELLDQIKSGQRDVAGVTVAGHADRAGPPDYNLNLSERRAQNVAAELIKGGVPARVIQTEGYGEEQPAVETGDGVPLQANRRAIIDLSY